MTDMYHSDVLTWSGQQAALLRRVADGERINDQVDWPNVIEEIEAVGQSQIDAVESLVTQAFLHMLKARAWPLLPDAAGWEADARLFLRQARRKYRPSMRQRIDVAGLYADALAGLPDKRDGQAGLPVPTACPVQGIEELLAEPLTMIASALSSLIGKPHWPPHGSPPGCTAILSETAKTGTQPPQPMMLGASPTGFHPAAPGDNPA